MFHTKSFNQDMMEKDMYYRYSSIWNVSSVTIHSGGFITTSFNQDMSIKGCIQCDKLFKFGNEDGYGIMNGLECVRCI